MEKVRLDTLLVQRGLAEHRHHAQGLIMAGRVAVDGRVVDKPGTHILEDVTVAIRESPRYASRGGLKLEHALACFGIDVSQKAAVDVGASTGGFTDCLLQREARKVYAIDVGYGQLAWHLRQDPRVVVMDRTNVRHLESLPEPMDLATIDVSFISLELVLPQVVKVLQPRGEILALVKPQFEARRDQVSRGGVVRDPAVHRLVLEKIVRRAIEEQLRVRGLTPVPFRGPAGNVEFFIHLSRDQRLEQIDVKEAMDACLSQAGTI